MVKYTNGKKALEGMPSLGIRQASRGAGAGPGMPEPGQPGTWKPGTTPGPQPHDIKKYPGVLKYLGNRVLERDLFIIRGRINIILIRLYY